MFLQPNKLNRNRMLITASVFCLAYALLACLPASTFALLFCRLPALLSSLYLNVPHEGSVLILSASQTFEVKRACGGSDFFVMVFAMVSWYYLKASRPRWGLALLAIPVWLLVNGVNSLRIVTLVWVHAVGQAFVPERFYGALHLVSGVLIFFPALLGVWWLCKRIWEVNDERHT